MCLNFKERISFLCIGYCISGSRSNEIPVTKWGWVRLFDWQRVQFPAIKIEILKKSSAYDIFKHDDWLLIIDIELIN